jgi:hypothetical protein
VCASQRRRYVTDVLYFLYPDLLHLHSANQSTHGEANLFTGTVIVPSSDKPENMHASSLNHHRYVPSLIYTALCSLSVVLCFSCTRCCCFLLWRYHVTTQVTFRNAAQAPAVLVVPAVSEHGVSVSCCGRHYFTSQGLLTPKSIPCCAGCTLCWF